MAGVLAFHSRRGAFWRWASAEIWMNQHSDTSSISGIWRSSLTAMLYQAVFSGLGVLCPRSSLISPFRQKFASRAWEPTDVAIWRFRAIIGEHQSSLFCARSVVSGRENIAALSLSGARCCVASISLNFCARQDHHLCSAHGTD